VLGGQAIWILKSLICAIGVAGLWNLRSRADHQRRARMILTRGIGILGAPALWRSGIDIRVIAPTVAHGYLVHFLAAEPTAEPGTWAP
jgi:hypothetical protein